MMSVLPLLIIIIILLIIPGSLYYLFHCLVKNRQLLALVGLFCFVMGIFLLLLDLALITFSLGPQHIPDYLMFNRLVSDTGFAGRWVLTVYVFLSAGVLFTIYLLARNLIRKLNDNEASRNT